MRKALSSLLRALNGSALILAGLLVGCWAWAGVYETGLAFEFALWAAENSPLQLTVTPLQLANEVLQPAALRGAAFVAAALFAFAIINHLMARGRQRLDDQHRGGEAQVVLKTEHPRVGGALQGSLRLLEQPMPEQVYRLELSCRREYKAFADDRKDRVETVFFEEREIQVVQTAEGWSVPFQFEIPVTAPPSAPDTVPYGGYAWRLAFYRAEAAIAFPTGVVLSVDPAIVR